MAKKIRIIPELDESKLRQQLNDIGKKREKITVDVNTENISNADQNIKHLNNTVSASNSVFGKLKNTICNTFSSGRIALTGYLMVLNEINKAGKNAKQTIQEIDKAVTDLSVATNMSRESVTGLIKDYNTYAKQLASTTTQITSAADDYLRAGKSMSEAQTLIKDSIMLSKLGQLDSGTATEDLLAVMNGYEMSIDEVGKALDAMVAIDMKAATSAGDIATALKYCASSADVAGLSFNKLSAMIATTQEKTMQSAETIGTFMNTLLSRYRNVKIGQFVDDDGEDLSEVETILNSLDIKLRDSSQEFRDFETVIEEVALSWDNYSSVQQAAISKAFSGTRQQNRFIALMEGYNKTLELTEVAANSAGTAIDKFNNSYMESLEAKQNTLQASFESMIMNTDFSEVYAGILDATTALIDFVNQTNTLKGILTGLTVAGGIKGFLAIKTGVNEAYIALNKFQNALDIVGKTSISTAEYERLLLLSNGLSTSQMKLVLSTNSLSVAQKKELLMASGLSEEEAILQMQTWKMTAANIGLTASTVSLGNAFKSLWATMIANPLVMITTLVSATVMAYQTYKQHVVEASEATKEAIETFESISSEVESLEGKLSDLNKQISKLDPITDAEDIENLQLETEELEKQLAILKEKQRIASADADKAAQKSLGMTEASRYKTEERESAYGGIESGAAYVTKDEELRNAIEAYEEYKQRVDEANDALANMAKTGEYTQEEWNEQERIVYTYSEKMDDARSHANELATTLEEQKQGLDGNTESSQALLTKIDDVIIKYEAWLNEINGVTEALGEQADAEEEVSETANSISFEQAWGDSFTSKNDEVKKLSENLLGLAEKGRLTKETFELADSNAGDYFKNLGISADEAVSKINKLVDEASQLSSMSGEISKISKALSTKHEDGFVDADTLSGFDVEIKGLDSWDRFQSVLGSTTSSYQECKDAAEALANEWVNSGNFLAQLTDQNKEYYQTQLEAMGVANAEEVVMHQLALAKEEARIATLDLANMTEEAMAGLIGEAESAGITQGEIYKLAAAEIAYNSTGLDTQGKIEQLGNLAKAYGDTATAAIAASAANRVANGHGDLETVMSDMMAQINRAAKSYTIDWSGLGKGAKSAGRKAGDAYVDAFEKELKKLQTLRDQGKITEKEYLDYLRKLYQKFFRDKKKYAEQYARYEHEYLQGMKSLYESALSGITSMLDKQISAYSDAKSAAVESLEAQRDAAIEAKEAEKERYEQEIKLIDKQIAAKQKIISGIQDEIDSMREANEQRKRAITLQQDEYNLQRQLNQKTKLIYTEDGFKYDIDTSGLRDAKQKVEDDKLEIEIANKEKEIKLIEKEIDLLEERKSGINEQISLLDDQIDEINKMFDKMIKDTEKYWDNLIKGLEDYKSRWEELAEIEENAKLISTLKQLGIETDDILGMSEEAFAKFKDEYIGILADIYSGNDSMLSALSDTTGRSVDEMGSYLNATQGYIDSLSGVGESLNPVAEAIGNVDENMSSLSSTASDANTNLSETESTTSDIATNVDNIANGINQIPDSQKITDLSGAFDTLAESIDKVAKALGLSDGAEIGTLTKAMSELNSVTLGSEAEGIIGQFTLLKNAITEVINTIGLSGSQTVGSLIQAINELNSVTLDESIIKQFTNLKEAIDSVTAAISGGGGESSGGDSQGVGSSSSSGGESGGKGSQGSGGSNSLTGAITKMGETANEVIGEPDADGDGTVIGEFGSMETAVNDVRDAIGTEGSEGNGGNSGCEGDDTLVGSIEYLDDKTEEELGEPDGDGIIGRFTEFKDVIEEAANQVKSISDGLDEIDGKEVECTITINVKMNGSIPAFASGTVLGNMNIESATYNAKYGKAFASGTIGLPKAEKNALVSEYGQTEMTVLPDGQTIITDTPTLMDLPKDTVIFNEEQTKKIMDNKVDASGKAHAEGTIVTSDGTVYEPYDPDKDDSSFAKLYKAWNKYYGNIDKNVEDISRYLAMEHSQNMNKEVNQFVNSASSVVNNTRNVQQPVAVQIGDINLTGVQDVNGLANAIKTRLPNAMLQEIHKR